MPTFAFLLNKELTTVSRSPIATPHRPSTSAEDEDDDALDEWIADNEEVLENDFTFRAVGVGLLVGSVTSLSDIKCARANEQSTSLYDQYIFRSSNRSAPLPSLSHCVGPI
jgi:hypothetical protein